MAFSVKMFFMGNKKVKTEEISCQKNEGKYVVPVATRIKITPTDKQQLIKSHGSCVACSQEFDRCLHVGIHDFIFFNECHLLSVFGVQRFQIG